MSQAEAVLLGALVGATGVILGSIVPVIGTLRASKLDRQDEKRRDRIRHLQKTQRELAGIGAEILAAIGPGFLSDELSSEFTEERLKARISEGFYIAIGLGEESISQRFQEARKNIVFAEGYVTMDLRMKAWHQVFVAVVEEIGHEIVRLVT